jgi:bacteriocin biosynthesis cyclodehydratase domain-containing protein
MICATHGGNRQLSEIVNRASVVNDVPTIYYHAQGLQVQLGPLVIPKQTACYECYKVRRDAALAPWERSVLRLAEDGGQLASTLGADWVMVEAIKFLVGFGEPVSRGRVLFIDYYAGLPEVHTVLRLPRCAVCGHPKRPVVRLWDDSF